MDKQEAHPEDSETSRAQNDTIPTSIEVAWEENDPENPVNWPLWYKIFIMVIVTLISTVVILYSSSYTPGLPGVEASFQETSRTVVLLGLTTYLLGLALGNLTLTPFCEIYGRRPVHLVSTALFMILTIPVALAPNLAAVLASRFFCGFVGAGTLATAPGSVSDLFGGKDRALAFSCWSLGTMNAPVIGPIMGGFVFQYLGWRWINWVVLICGGVSFIGLVLSKETYAPILLKTRLRARQQQSLASPMHQLTLNDNHSTLRWWAQIRRPLSMAVREPICIFWDLYVGIFYAVLFLCFVGYPIVFQDIRGWSPGIAGLGYCGIGAGVTLAVITEPLMRILVARYSRDSSAAAGQVLPEAYVGPICIGGILVPIGQFWFAWTADRESIHWIVPILSGVPFGCGNALVFIYSMSYLASSYGVYTASAVAGQSAIRYVFSGLLPLAGTKMYHALGVHWTGTMLGCIQIFLIPIPFMFYRYGGRIRKRSSLISSLG